MQLTTPGPTHRAFRSSLFLAPRYKEYKDNTGDICGLMERFMETVKECTRILLIECCLAKEYRKSMQRANILPNSSTREMLHISFTSPFSPSYLKK